MNDQCYAPAKQLKAPRFALHRLLLVLLLFAIMLPFVMTVPILASNISDAEYTGRIAVTNNGTAATNESVPFSLSTQTLIDGYYVYSNLTNTAIRTPSGADIPYMPAQGATDQWIIFVDQIGQDGQLDKILYTGGGDMGSTIYYFPAAAGMATDDHSTLELGTNFTIEQSAYIDTSSGGRLVEKDSSFIVWNSDTGNITAGVNQTAVLTSAYLYPVGVGTNNTIPGVTGEATHWEAVDDPQATPDDITTYIWNNNDDDIVYYDSFILTNDVVPDGVEISAVYIVFRCRSQTGVGIGKEAEGYVLLNGQITNTTRATVFSWADRTEEVTRPGGGNWTVADLNDLEGGVGLWVGNGLVTSTYCTQVYVRVDYISDYTYDASVTATGVASGEHVINVAYEGYWLTIDVDAVEQDAHGEAFTVPDNANPWTFFSDEVAPYVDYHMIYTSSGLSQHIAWQNAATFTDQSGTGNDATPTFRTASSNANITANLTVFGALSLGQLLGTSTDAASYILTDPPGDIPEFVGELNTVHLPGASLINNALEAAEIPQAAFWFPFTIGLSALAGLIAFGFTRSLFTQALVSAFFMFFFSLTGGGIIPWWSAVIFIVEAFAILVSKKQVAL